MKSVISDPALVRQHFLDACCESISEVFSQALTTSWKAKEVPEPGDSGEKIFVRFAVSKSYRGELAFAISLTSATLLAQTFTGATTDGFTWNEDAREAVEELLRQVSGRWATLAASAGGIEIRFAGGGRPEWLQSSQATHFEVSAKSQSMVLTVHVSPELADGLSGRDAGVSLPNATSPVDLQHDSNRKTARESILDGNLEILMELELTALLRFGRKTMPLRDVLELSSGAVIELDRQVQDPVELLLDGRVVARGEVVIVDGNYGLRVTEVASTTQRANLLQ
jgi:flagellar motor switch protein FliN/FliY